MHSKLIFLKPGIKFKNRLLTKLNKKLKIIVVLLFLSGFASLLIQRCTPKDEKTVETTNSNHYVGDQTCKSCHASQYKDWLSSDHFKAMQVANDSTVEGDFNNTTYTADGVTSHFFKKAGKYYINTQGPDGNNHDYEIKYTFGYNPLQQYLIAFPGGRLQVTRQCWDVNKKRWFHQYAGQRIPAHDWLHWTGNAQNWNTECAACHSTNLHKNYDFNNDTYHTTYSVMTVSCESCHGAGQMHIDYIKSEAYKNGEKVKNSYLQMTKNSNQQTQINTCAPCHSRRSEVSADKIMSPQFLDNYIPQIPTKEFYYADGQAKDEDYVYTSFLESKMYSRGVECSNCHNPHSGKVLYTTNALCLQCHAKTYDDISHTFHQAGTIGAECKSCHMPSKIYMGNDLRYDHTFRVPRPDLSVKYGTPNACNNCHKDKSATWAANAVVKWYGPNRAYHFAEDLIPASKEDAHSEGHIMRLLNDTATPAIIKATALYYLKDINTENSSQTLLKSLQDKKAQIRYQALRSLADFPAQVWLDAVGPALSDKVRAVRIAAADLYITIPPAQVPPSYYAAFTNAKKELETYTLYQTDFSTGDALAGDYYLKLNDYYNAEKFYLLGLKKDTALNYARLNLSVLYNIKGENSKALKVLQDALMTDPKNDHIYFNMALLYNEMKDPLQAEVALSKAVALKTQNPRVYYNYGLLLEQHNKRQQAVNMFDKGLELSPLDADINYALCILYFNSNQIDKAKEYGLVLKKYYSANPDYRGIIQQLGL
ncbi:MAG: tetratricopeptide repeat protein [Bacteroidota bacterium]|nr:tetratricopeptide repeat protein [Bacteroidota bacterium]